MLDHERYMRMAIGLATQGRGVVSPNPLVGSVIVNKGVVVGRGYHKGPGKPHAEIEALKNARGNTQGGTIYINLEPCNHTGRTGPCAPEIVAAGIKRVFIGISDPNPIVSGKGIRMLKKSGVEVVQGLLEKDSKRINEVYFKYITTGMPFVIMKAAMSLDGNIAGKHGESKWISGEKSRTLVHRIRADMDGILVGAGTVKADDPELTVRMVPVHEGRLPRPIVVDEKLIIKPVAKVFKHPSGPVIATIKNSGSKAKRKKLEDKGAEIIDLPAKKGLVSLKALLKKLGKMEMSNILVEGGAGMFASFLNEKLVDKAYLFYTPVIIGEDGSRNLVRGPAVSKIPKISRGRIETVTRVGGDVLLEVRF